MTEISQRGELHAKIWRIANDVRGTVDGWDFKQYVLCSTGWRSITPPNNLAQMNMFFHCIDYNCFWLAPGNTPFGSAFRTHRPFDAIIAELEA